MPNGANTANFYFKDTKAGSFTLTTSSAGFTAGTQTENVNAASAIKLGFAKSLSHPGGNMTGLASLLPDLEAKSLQLLAELVPGLTRTAIS